MLPIIDKILYTFAFFCHTAYVYTNVANIGNKLNNPSYVIMPDVNIITPNIIRIIMVFI